MTDNPNVPGKPPLPPQSTTRTTNEDTRGIQPPNAPRPYPSLPGEPISDEEHAFLKASREKREQKWEALRKLAAEIGATVSNYPTPNHPPHVPSKYVGRGDRPSGLTLDQEVENERYYDDTERNTLHREQEIKKAAEADAKLNELKRHELERADKDRKNENRP